MTFGCWPDVSLEKAHARCQQQREVLADGLDPMAQRKVERQIDRQKIENTFRALAKQWHAHWKQGRSPRHADYVWSRLERDILRSIGSRSVRLALNLVTSLNCTFGTYHL